MKTRSLLCRCLVPLAVSAGLLGLAMGPLPMWGFNDCMRTVIKKPFILAEPGSVKLTSKAGSDPFDVFSYPGLTGPGSQYYEGTHPGGAGVSMSFPITDPITVKGVILKDTPATCGNSVGARGFVIWP